MTLPTGKYDYEYPKKAKLRSYSPILKGHAGQIKKAVDLIYNASRPIVYSGGGVILGKSSHLLTELVKKLGFPVTNTLMGLGGFPGNDPQFLGMLGMHGSVAANMAMHHSDLIIAVGARFDDRVTNATSKFCPDAKIIHIDVDPASISKTVPADIPIVGPVDSVLTDLLDLLKNHDKTISEDSLKSWWEQIEKWRARHNGEYSKNDNGLLKPQEVIESLYRATDGDAYVTSDVGQHQMFAAQYYKFDKPNRWINSGGLGTMGFGFPAAMAIKLNKPDAKVVCVTGEGSIQMNIQELSTCLQYQIPVKIITLNNQSLGMVRQWQDMNYEGRHSHSYMESIPDFIKLVEAYGHVGIRVNKADELEAAFHDCFVTHKDRLVFMDIYVDPSEHVYPMQVPQGTMRDMWLSKTERI